MSVAPLNAAIAYAKHGYAVLPVWSCLPSGICRCPEGSSCRSPGKHPQSQLVPRGYKQATTDLGIIERWYTADPEAGVGIYLAGSGLLAIDVDPRNGGDQTLLEFLARNPGLSLALDSTVEARTQAGGSHHLFKSTEGASYPGSLGKGIDVKHEGYICVEPTLGPMGPYQWIDGKSPFDIEPLPIEDLIPEKSSIQSVPSDNFTYPPDASALRDLKEALYLLDHNDYRTWIDVGHALKTAGEPGSELWLEWSRRSHKFKEADAKRTWRSFAPTKTHWKAVFTYKNESVNAKFEKFKVNGRPVAVGALVSQRPKQYVYALDGPIQKFTLEEVNAARPHPQMLVEKYLYAELRNLIAAGGTGKTTLVLYEAIMGALGRPIWGRNVPKPFTTIIVTKEDSRELIAHRLGQICDANALSDEEKASVFDRVYAIDFCGTTFRLANHSGGTVQIDADAIDRLIEHCKAVNPNRIIFDPLVSFGAGEAQVNDSEQAIVEAARYMMKALPDCAIDVIHHTGKQNARNNSSDQYSGRNGTALPDGSRMVAVLNEIDRDAFRDNTGLTLLGGESGLRLTLPKLSYCERQKEIFIRREGYLFEAIPPLSDAEIAKNIEATRHARLSARDQRTEDSIISALMACRASDDPRYKYPSKKLLLERQEVFGATPARENALNRLIEAGVILEMPLTADQIAEFVPRNRLGGRKTYLALSPDYE